MRRTWLPALLAFVVVAAGNAINPTGQPATAQPAPAAGRSAIYGGGPFYAAVRPSWTRCGHRDSPRSSCGPSTSTPTATWYYNDTSSSSDGQYIGDAGWPARLRTLKQAPTSVNRIEVSVGAWGMADWETIDKLITATGTGPGSILYRNFQALLTATGADAINNDDESHYDVASTVSSPGWPTDGIPELHPRPVHELLLLAGVKDNLGRLSTAYTSRATRAAPATTRPRGHRPWAWPVDPGLWSRHGSGCTAGDTPAQVRSQMRHGTTPPASPAASCGCTTTSNSVRQPGHRRGLRTGDQQRHQRRTRPPHSALIPLVAGVGQGRSVHSSIPPPFPSRCRQNQLSATMAGARSSGMADPS